MRTILLLLAVLAAPLAHAQLQQIVTDTDTALGYLGGRFDDICMVDDSTGYVLTSYNYILKTTDGFQTVQLSGYTNGYARSIAFLNEEVGFAGSLTGRLHETRDGGQTWQNITSLLIANDSVIASSRGICGLAQVGNTVYACGAYFGRSFVARFNGPDQAWTYYDMRGYASGLIDMLWLSEDTGFVTGKALNPADGGVILRTNDGGVTWQEVYTTDTMLDNVWKIYALNDSVFFGCIEESAPHTARIIKSTDGGQTWTQHQVSDVYVGLQTVGFVNASQGFAGGHFAGYFITNDGGLNWQFVNDTTVGQLNRFIAVGQGVYLASGRGVFRAIDSTYAPPGTGIMALPQPLSMPLKAYPSPAADAFSLELALPEATYGHLMIYSINGGILGQLPRQHWAKGNHVQQFDVSQYPAGTVYIGFVADHGNWYLPVVIEK